MIAGVGRGDAELSSERFINFQLIVVNGAGSLWHVPADAGLGGRDLFDTRALRFA